MSSLLFGLRRHLAEWLPRSPALPRFRHWTSLELPTFTLTNSLLRVLILGLLDVIDLQQVASEFHVITNDPIPRNPKSPAIQPQSTLGNESCGVFLRRRAFFRHNLLRVTAFGRMSRHGLWPCILPVSDQYLTSIVAVSYQYFSM